MSSYVFTEFFAAWTKKAHAAVVGSSCVYHCTDNVVDACVLGLKPDGNYARLYTAGRAKTEKQVVILWKSKGEQRLSICHEKSGLATNF